jgi:uncharacterized protein (TIGR00251 family)
MEPTAKAISSCVFSCVTAIPSGVRILVRAQPRASRSAVIGCVAATPQDRSGARSRGEQGELKVAVAAPPVDGAANAAIVELLADVLGVPKRNVVITRGEGGRSKQVEVSGIDEQQACTRLARAAGAPAR